MNSRVIARKGHASVFWMDLSNLNKIIQCSKAQIVFLIPHVCPLLPNKYAFTYFASAFSLLVTYSQVLNFLSLFTAGFYHLLKVLNICTNTLSDCSILLTRPFHPYFFTKSRTSSLLAFQSCSRYFG